MFEILGYTLFDGYEGWSFTATAPLEMLQPKSLGVNAQSLTQRQKFIAQDDR